MPQSNGRCTAILSGYEVILVLWPVELRIYRRKLHFILLYITIISMSALEDFASGIDEELIHRTL